MKRFVLSLLLLTLFTIPAFAEDLSLLPKYGGIERNAEQKAADKQFLIDAVKAAGSKEKASEHCTARGWEALKSGDAKTAMRRFNQAWLLSGDKSDILWGLGAASGELGNFDASFKLLDEAAAADPHNANLLNDVGFARVRHATRTAKSKEEAFKDLDFASEYFKRAAAEDDRGDRAFFNLAMVSMYKGDYAAAWKHIGEAEARGGTSIDPRFVQDLQSKMPRPAK